jgi:alginate O-acetyltransferase complex protein AlgI
MDFLSIAWLASIAGVTALYWIVPARVRPFVLPVATAALVGWASPLTVAALTFSVVLCWASYKHLESGWAIAATCAAQLLPLVAWRLDAQVPLPVIAGILIPLGLAYITLRSVHYLIEAYKRDLPAHRLADVIGYFFFLPTIVAGPIHRFPAWLADQRRLRWNPELFSEGLERILYGYVKIAFLANVLIETRFTGWIHANLADGSRGTLYLLMIAKGLNGYFQFAGYSDVAIGFARLLGFKIIENFDAPLIKPNVQRFWSAWHISLTSWCRDYVYTPVFSLTRARALGIVASMAVLGLWHEFTPRYLAWGLYNGVGIVAWHRWRRVAGERLEDWLDGKPLLTSAWYVLAILMTVHFIFLGFVLVQHPSLTESVRTIGAMIGPR